MSSDDQIKLPQDVVELLNKKGLTYELEQHGNNVHLVIKDYSFPESYAPRTADLMMIFPPNYPNEKLDMFWTNPEVKLVNGQFPDRCNHIQNFNGKNWQRWSRHGNWRVGIDDFRTFFAGVGTEILKGI